jgi:protein CpxP
MDQTRFLKTIIILLLLINAGTILFMWTHRPLHPDRPPHPELGAYLMHELHFSSEQRHQFEGMRDAHRKLAAPWREKNTALHEALYALVNEKSSDTAQVNLLTDSIADVQRKIERSMFYHLKEVRTICTPEQQEKFEEVIHGAIQLMNPGPPPKQFQQQGS